MIHNEDSPVKDREGVIIQFSNTKNWMEASDTGTYIIHMCRYFENDLPVRFFGRSAISVIS